MRSLQARVLPAEDRLEEKDRPTPRALKAIIRVRNSAEGFDDAIGNLRRIVLTEPPAGTGIGIGENWQGIGGKVAKQKARDSVTCLCIRAIYSSPPVPSSSTPIMPTM